MYTTFSRKLSQQPFLTQFLNGESVVWRPIGFMSDHNQAVVGWGLRPSTLAARRYAAKNKLPFIALEDGFLRSFRPGQSSPPLSIVRDQTGIYYDCHRPSDLESLLNSEEALLSSADYRPEDVHRARQILVDEQLSKYNHAPDFDSDVFSRPQWRDRRRILVVDQTYGDMSIVFGGASEAQFSQMLAFARSAHPDALIVVKTHPEVSSGAKQGYLSQVTEDDNTCVLRGSVNPMGLILSVDEVYVVTSTMGFEALLAGKPVTTFGAPWYAGWGCTQDKAPVFDRAHFENALVGSAREINSGLTPASDWRARRTRSRSVAELFAAAYFRYARYLNPKTHERGDIFDVIDWLLTQKLVAQRYSGRMIAVGFPTWRRYNTRALLSAYPHNVVFARDVTALKALNIMDSDHLIYWGKKIPTGLSDLADKTGAKSLCMEDGFIRSVGLGSDLIRPHSLVLDGRGIYFDPSAPSDLEHVLNHCDFNEIDIVRAQAVRTTLVEQQMTKYNIDEMRSPPWVDQTRGRRVVFVPGQVEDDASIQFGCTTVKTNLALLQAARKAHPDAYIVYKPHPDVLAKNRVGSIDFQEVKQYADTVETNCSVIDCIRVCDVVHTMTSLTGFDALLRGKKVMVYGRPFYSGWGLTEDLGEQFAQGRRVRKLSLDELVAGALLHYPIYYNWALKGYTSCEATMHTLIDLRARMTQSGAINHLRRGKMRRLWRKVKVLLYAYGTELFKLQR